MGYRYLSFVLLICINFEIPFILHIFVILGYTLFYDSLLYLLNISLAIVGFCILFYFIKLLLKFLSNLFIVFMHAY